MELCDEDYSHDVNTGTLHFCYSCHARCGNALVDRYGENIVISEGRDQERS